MEIFADYLASIDKPEHRERTAEVLTWIADTFPNLKPRIAWNQPIFTDHDTYIIGLSVSKQHLAISPESAGIDHFSDEIIKAGYDHTKMLMRIKWSSPVNYDLLQRMIEFNMTDKADCTTFWRKS